MKNTTVVISGANSGIGKHTAIQLAQKGAKIIMVCRSKERGEAAQQEIIEQSGNKEVLLELCDLASQKSIHDFGNRFREQYDSIDVLVNNAGALFGERKETEDGLEYTFGVNHIGYFLPTHYLLDALERGGMKRIVNVSSLMHGQVRKFDLEDLQSKKNYSQFSAYSLSKLCNVYFTNELARRLQAQGSKITVNSLHPGVIGSNFGSSGNSLIRNLLKVGRFFMTSPSKGASTSVYLASSPKIQGITGKYFSNSKEKRSSKLAQSEENAQRLWDISMQLTGLDEYGKV